ncbi:MAG: ABC transporter ATP-binding protein, partial [Clostridia bacterium]
MPEIILENVTKRWGKFYAVDNLNLVIEDNSFITLLGPSGCGKTTTLRMIAGLETPTSGKIIIGGKTVFDSDLGINIPPNKRKVGFLFQNYALWPNMTVYQNISFGLKNIKEVMPTYSEDIKISARLIEILEDSQTVINTIEDCRDKSHKIDVEKAYVKLMDTYLISIYTARTLFNYKLYESQDVSADCNKIISQLQAKIDSTNAKYKSRGLEVNENFEIVKNGKVVEDNRKLTNEEVDLSVRRVSRIVKIGMFMDRYPAELSGGQQQRVAIARTLAPEPTVLFMDEPLSNLDAKLRLEMRYELQRLHVETGSTFVYVTHDQMEAMTLATKICLIDNGVLQQYQAPLEVYNRPTNTFVADFVGNPSINFIEASGKQNSDGAFDLQLLNGVEGTFVPNESFDVNKWFLDRDSANQLSTEQDIKDTADKQYVEKGNKDVKFKYHISKVE